ncbi:ferrous iron transport protein B [Thermodesulfobacteriota bacterium]
MQATVALAGNPNSGKTTLFNALTGAHQHVGNYPGVTVEKKEGTYKHKDFTLHIVDLPGTYSLTAYSLEEVVARDYLVNEKPEVVINIVDSSNLERNLYLAVQFLEMGIPVCIALNMIDVAKKRGIEVNAEKLSTLLGVPVVPTIARIGQGKNELMESAAYIVKDKMEFGALKISYGDDVDIAMLDMEKEIETNRFLTDVYPARWVALKFMEKDEQILSQGKQINPELAARLEEMVKKVARHLLNTLDTYPEAMIADQRYGYIKSILKQGVIYQKYDQNRLYSSDKIDKVLTNRFLGPLIMLAVLAGLFHVVFTYSEVPVGWLESIFSWISHGLYTLLPDGLLRSLIVSGIIDGVGGVLGFVPLIMFMFFGIAFLEDSGYLARVAFMLDRVFRIFGLHGSSVMAFIVSGGIAGGCAVPGVMATRTLKSPRERLATLLTVPFMNCGAKLPVFALLIAAFFAKYEAAVMFAITLGAWAGALLVAKLLRVTIIKGEATPFVMELPPYRMPTFKGLAIHTWERTWQYIKKAGTVILGFSVILWSLMTFPMLPESRVGELEARRQSLLDSVPAAVSEELENINGGSGLSGTALDLKKQLQIIDFTKAEAGLRYSVAGRIGTALESVSQWAGFDWRTNIALLGGFAAKEIMVSTLGTAYSLGDVDPEDSGSLSEKLARDPGWSPLMALGLIVFTMFYAPCFVSVVCITKESGSWKWGAFAIIFNTLLAFGLAVLIFQTGSALGVLTN